VNHTLNQQWQMRSRTDSLRYSQMRTRIYGDQVSAVQFPFSLSS